MKLLYHNNRIVHNCPRACALKCTVSLVNIICHHCLSRTPTSKVIRAYARKYQDNEIVCVKDYDLSR